MGFKIGICGVSAFGHQFIDFFKTHNLVDEVIISDLDSKLLNKVVKQYQIEKTAASFDELIKTDVDAVAIFTQRWRHAPQAIKALKAGKHVFSAVPAAQTLEEVEKLVRTVEETGLMYMLAETSYYRPQTIYCRKRYASGDFGRFVYGEGQYYHDMAEFYEPYFSNGDKWKSFASFPPMLYSTHSLSHILSVTFSRMTEVSCFGFVDEHPDGIFNKELSRWDNVFSNETALFRTADGGSARINEFRRTGAGESRMSIIGTIGAYEEQPSQYEYKKIMEDVKRGIEQCKMPVDSAIWTYKEKFAKNPVDGKFDYKKAYTRNKCENVSQLHFYLYGVVITEDNLGNLPKDYIGRRHEGVTPYHPIERIPEEFVGMDNGHCGSHQFLVIDFMEALETGKLPPNNVWIAARYNAPGIVAHQSALKGGELLNIPDFGKPPSKYDLMDLNTELKD